MKTTVLLSQTAVIVVSRYISCSIHRSDSLC